MVSHVGVAVLACARVFVVWLPFWGVDDGERAVAAVDAAGGEGDGAVACVAARHVSSTCFASVMGWVLRGAKTATVPVGKFRRCVWIGFVASVVIAVMVRFMSCFSLFPEFLCCPGVRACRSSAVP